MLLLLLFFVAVVVLVFNYVDVVVYINLLDDYLTYHPAFVDMGAGTCASRVSPARLLALPPASNH